jgi:hypothetical protein
VDVGNLVGEAACTPPHTCRKGRCQSGGIAGALLPRCVVFLVPPVAHSMGSCISEDCALLMRQNMRVAKESRVECWMGSPTTITDKEGTPSSQRTSRWSSVSVVAPVTRPSGDSHRGHKSRPRRRHRVAAALRCCWARSRLWATGERTRGHDAFHCWGNGGSAAMENTVKKAREQWENRRWHLSTHECSWREGAFLCSCELESMGIAAPRVHNDPAHK